MVAFRGREVVQEPPYADFKRYTAPLRRRLLREDRLDYVGRHFLIRYRPRVDTPIAKAWGRAHRRRPESDADLGMPEPKSSDTGTA
ncbi:hypothetical protein CPLU01_00616 [Colletotrichum plurivorum]|uniref:Uncharacterized protein n=1 Tax=Colletotrichum plurivorum TaxID=2175906 RepID=A0A8H6U697_9PEZI|nr:hypothetical protein CPLU01_00616 [Colletotrichum plurivorum]